LPVRIAAADLDGDGRDDLVVAAAGSNQVFIYQRPDATTYLSLWWSGGGK
jgi:hypothetical protein